MQSCKAVGEIEQRNLRFCFSCRTIVPKLMLLDCGIAEYGEQLLAVREPDTRIE